jgi:glutathione S-transferase
MGSKEASALPERPLPLVPYLVLPAADGGSPTAISDTTPILNRLEETYAERRLRPSDPALNLIDLLLEDYGDEWLSKCMFHYRWSYAADIKKASAYLPYRRAMQITREEGEQGERDFASRQISRIGVVGSNPVTAPIIESSWRRFLEIFEAHIQNQPYLLGPRPGAGDFAAFGQMTMLVITDPTPSQVAMEVSPRAYAWTERLEDVSGLDVSEADWIDLSDPPATLRDLLGEVGRVYVPYMIGNAKAISRGAKQVECEVDGQPWVQESFVYQAKCLGWLRKAYSELDETARGRVDRLLLGTGCEPLFAPL